MKRWGLVMRVQEGGPRKNTSSVEQSRGLKVWSTIKGNVLGDSTDKDTHHESTGQRKAMKYLRESCYHRIKCSVANSLAALMRKWYLNSNFQPYSYSQRLQESVDGIKINTNNLIYSWRVEMKGGRQYKLERKPWDKGIWGLREKHCKNKN